MKQKNQIKLNITQSATYGMERLSTYPCFQVHSVYRKTINLQADGNLIALQAEGSPLSPVSMITNLTQGQMEQLPATIGSPVYITASHLIFCTNEESPVPLFAFQYDQTKVSDLFLKPCGISDPDLFKELLRQIISKANTNGLDLVFTDSPLLESNMIMSAAKKRIDEAILLLEREDFEAAASTLIRLIGLGIGLTPSGDDFTSGILAGLILFNLIDHPFASYYRKEVKKHLFDTNDVSRTFLQAALDGHFSTAINSLSQIKKEDLNKNLPKAAQELLEKFLAIGHSSGIDALCGIYFVFLYLTTNHQ